MILGGGGLCVTYRRILDWMIGLLTPYIHHSELQAIQCYHYSHTVAHAFGFSVFTSRILATDFITVSSSLQITHDVLFS
jgi:hypothetical protein